MIETLNTAGMIAGFAGVSVVVAMYIIQNVLTKVKPVNQEQSFHLLNRIIRVVIVIVVIGALTWLASLLIVRGYKFVVGIEMPDFHSYSESSAANSQQSLAYGHIAYVIFSSLYEGEFKTQNDVLDDVLSAADWHGMYGITNDQVRVVANMLLSRWKRTGAVEVRYYNWEGNYIPKGDVADDITGHNWALVTNEKDEVAVQRSGPIKRSK